MTRTRQSYLACFCFCIKTFGTRGKYETNTAGVIDYTNNAYGVAYVHEDETLNLGKTSG